MKASEVREKTAEELREELAKLRENLRQMRFDLVAGKVNKVDDITKTKRDIARILTILNEESR